MKIRALRVAEVGKFREPRALEGFSDGLNVLAGPNELGKSTLFRALVAAFASPYTSADGKLKTLQPYAGGAPMVEVDFDASGKHWRVRKKFLAGRMAELHELSAAGASLNVVRNADVQAKLQALTAGPQGLEKFGLLWVGQGASLAPPEHPAGTPDHLRHLVQHEIEGATDDPQSRAVHGAVQKRLGELTTPVAARPAGAYAKALKELEFVTAKAAEAGENLRQAETRMRRLAAASAEAATLRAPEVTAQRQQVLLDARAKWDEAKKSTDLLKQAELLAKAAEATLTSARMALDDWTGKTAAIAKFDQEISDLTAAAADTEPERRRAEANLIDQRRAQDSIKNEIEAEERQLHGALAQAVQSAAAERRDAITRQLREAQRLAVRLSGMKSTLTAMVATAERVESLRSADARRAALAARLAAGAPIVVIEPAPGAGALFRVDGAPLPAEHIWKPTASLIIDIAVVGRITISPPDAKDFAAAKDEHDRLSGTITELLSIMAVPSLLAAQAALEQRRALEMELQQCDASLKAIAPKGLEPLQRQLAELPAAGAREPAAKMTDTPSVSIEVIEARRSSLIVQQRDGDAMLDQLRVVSERLQHAVIRRAAAIHERRQQRDNLAIELGPEQDRVAREKPLRDALMAAEAALASAIRETRAWRDVAPDAAALARLQNDVTTAEIDVGSSTRQLHALELTIRELEAALRAQFDADVETVATASQERLLEAKRIADEFAAEVAALRILDKSFAEVFQNDHARIVRPVMSRLAPYLSAVFPQAEMHLDASFLPTRLKRDGADEILERLSHGAREQISIIVRLGLGRVLADRGAEAPLILDDALVYADDQRIEAMFGALQEAARHHQVIVLTCRERTFAGLNGRKLQLEPWTP